MEIDVYQKVEHHKTIHEMSSYMKKSIQRDIPAATNQHKNFHFILRHAFYLVQV